MKNMEKLEEKKGRYNVILPPSIVKAIDDYAKIRGLSRSALIASVMFEYLAERGQIGDGRDIIL